MAFMINAGSIVVGFVNTDARRDDDIDAIMALVKRATFLYLAGLVE